MEAVRRLGPRDRRRIRVHVFTTASEQLRLDVARAGLSDVFVVRPLVPLLEFLSLADRLDVVLLEEAGRGLRQLVSSVSGRARRSGRSQDDDDARDSRSATPCSPRSGRAPALRS